MPLTRAKRDEQQLEFIDREGITPVNGFTEQDRRLLKRRLVLRVIEGDFEGLALTRLGRKFRDRLVKQRRAASTPSITVPQS